MKGDSAGNEGTWPRERIWLSRIPTRALKRALWHRMKRRRVQGTVQTVFGALMKCDTQDVIQRYIYYFGQWEPNLSAFLPRRLGDGDVFVDVGANIGYYSLLASKFVGHRGAVVAVEPQPAIRSLLEENLGLNACSNVRVVAEASTNVDRQLLMVFGGAHKTGGSSTVAAANGAPGTIVHGRPLFDQLTTDDRRRARLIKIDVEGAEMDALRGLHLDHGGYRADLEIVVEVSPERLRARGQDPRDLYAMLHSLGYHAYGLENDYRGRAYLDVRAPRRPMRLDRVLDREADIVFSRVDAAML